MKAKRWEWPGRFFSLLESPPPEPARQLHRIKSVERDIVLPVKGISLLVLGYFLLFGLGDISASRPGGGEGIRWLVVLETVQEFYIGYFCLNVLGGIVLLNYRRVPLGVLQWVVFTMGLLDALFISAATLVTGGFDSLMYWIFVALIVRNATSLPVAALQIVLNLLVSLCYVLAGVLDVVIVHFDIAFRDSSPEPFLLRLALLLFMTFCCYCVQVLFDKQRQADDEAREFAIRQEQLHAAGRLAAEIAHRLKNPLGIINNAAYTLQRGIKDEKLVLQKQVEIIREEVERTDRIITELMGYAQLVEGKVEKLDVKEELNRALEQVFPPGSKFETVVHRRMQDALPSLLMQRGHLSEIFVNLLQNAREILHGKGQIWVTAAYGPDYTVLVTIEDNGPGIPAENLERIFEPYFTTKEKGTGLGLAIVKHNIEIYGGNVRVESEEGKGARFLMQFRAKTLMRLSR